MDRLGATSTSAAFSSFFRITLVTLSWFLYIVSSADQIISTMFISSYESRQVELKDIKLKFVPVFTAGLGEEAQA